MSTLSGHSNLTHVISSSLILLPHQSGGKTLIYAQTICEDAQRHCRDQNTTFQSRFMLTTAMP